MKQIMQYALGGLVLCVVTTAVVGVSVVWFGPFAQGYTYSAVPASHSVVYQIATPECISFDATYAVPDGTAQKNMTACPDQGYVGSFKGHSGEFLYLSIQNVSRSPTRSRFSCIIQVDGKVIARVTSQGTSHIATCSESLP